MKHFTSLSSASYLVIQHHVFYSAKIKTKNSFQNSQLQSSPSSKFFFQWHISALCLLTRSSLHFISCQSGKAPKEGHVWYSFSILRKAHILSRYSSHLQAQGCLTCSSSSFYHYTSLNFLSFHVLKYSFTSSIPEYTITFYYILCATSFYT